MNKQEALLARQCVLHMEKTSHEEMVALDADLPSDVHLVEAEKDGKVSVDAVRAYKAVDVFDVYFDLGYTVKAIRNGYGRIKPKLWNATQGGKS